MKLAVEVSTCSSRRAGIGYYTEHLADALWATRAAGDDVVLISNGRPASELDDRWRDRLRIGGIPVRSIWMQRDAHRMLAEAGADFAVFPNYLAPLAVACPYVNIVHDLAIIRMPGFFNLRKLALQRPLLPHVIRRAAAVGTVSEASRGDIVRLLGVPEHRILMLPGAAHPACRVPARGGDRARPGRVRHRAAVRAVGRHAGAAQEPAAAAAGVRSAAGARRLARGGDRPGDHRRAGLARSRAARGDRAPAGDRARCTSSAMCPEQDLVPLYGGAEVLAFPSHFEGFGLPVVEAMACGTPVVASDVAALREVAGGAATLVPAGDEAALADALATFVGDADGARAGPRARPGAGGDVQLGGHRRAAVALRARDGRRRAARRPSPRPSPASGRGSRSTRAIPDSRGRDRIRISLSPPGGERVGVRGPP